MAGGSSGMAEQDKIIKIFRPAWRSLWFLFFGLALGPLILALGRSPQGPFMWVGLSLLCLGVILHRLSLKYTLTEKKLTAQAWWGRGPVETLTLARLNKARPRLGWAGRLTGVAHLEVYSLDPDEPGLTLLGQPAYRDLADLIETLAAEAGDGRR